jgi:hypothetical protein
MSVCQKLAMMRRTLVRPPADYQHYDGCGFDGRAVMRFPANSVLISLMYHCTVQRKPLHVGVGASRRAVDPGMVSRENRVPES